MKRVTWVVLMVAVAVGVGVLVALAEHFPGGVRTPAVTIGTTAAEGEGEGLPNTLEFENYGSQIVFDQPYSTLDFREDDAQLRFRGESSLIWFDQQSNILSLDGGVSWFGNPFGSQLGVLAGGPADRYFGHISDDYYAQLQLSSGLSCLLSTTGVVAVGQWEEQWGQDTESYEGAFLWGEAADTGARVSMVHAAPTGGLGEGEGESEGEGEGEGGPIVEMATYGSEQAPVTASLTLKGNDTQGEITMTNATNASFSITAEGDVVIRLGDTSTQGGLIAGRQSAGGANMSSRGSSQGAGTPRATGLDANSVINRLRGQ